MRLAVSNIGWTEAHDATIAGRLRDAGADALEVAPGRVFADPITATLADAEARGEALAAAGLPVVSMQSLLYGRPELTLFGSQADREALLAHLGHIMALAGRLGCAPLVFGSPRNRQRGGRSFAQATAEAVPILRRIGDIAAATGTVFCLEANASDYGCDFMTVLAEATAVADATGHPGIGQVVDTGNMMMEGEAPAAAAAAIEHVRHVHVSAQQLGPVAPHRAFIADVVGTLAGAGYAGGVTLEMRAPGPEAADPLADLLRGVEAVRGVLDGLGG